MYVKNEDGTYSGQLLMIEALNDFIERRVMGSDPMAMADEGKCVYRQDVNGGCAIGKWIPNELYRGEFENQNVMTLFDDQPHIARLFEPALNFWSYLQQSHDNLAIYAFYKAKLDALDKDDPDNSSYHRRLVKETKSRWEQFQTSLRNATRLDSQEAEYF
jgi:hypothetical protein